MAKSEKRKRAVEHLEEALDAEESDAKQFHIREALQLLDMEDG